LVRSLELSRRSTVLRWMGCPPGAGGCPEAGNQHLQTGPPSLK